MTSNEVIKYVNDGANNYLMFFAQAPHMEYLNYEYYNVIRPKSGYQGVQFVFNVNINDLPQTRQIEIINEIKNYRMPIWWSLPIPSELYKLIYSKDKPKGSINDAELYMAVLPHSNVDNQSIGNKNIKIKEVNSKELFTKWAEIANANLSNGYQDIHPENHYEACKNGIIKCYIGYENEKEATIASIMDKDGIASLEIVATVPEYRNKGFAKLICKYAIDETFNNGAKIITVRAMNPYTKE
jgi:hypothetical protein